VLLVVSAEVGEVARADVAAVGTYRVKAVTGARNALAAIADTKPQVLVFESGLVPTPAMQAVRNMAELTASRKVPIIMICGPLDPAQEKLRVSLGISEVLDGPYNPKTLLLAIQHEITKIDKQLEDTRLRRQTASNRYATLTEETARQRLNPDAPPIPEAPESPAAPDIQDFASDDAAPPATEKPSEPKDPTWDGSGG
jgi:DNA-binding response OmpR family regulator